MGLITSPPAINSSSPVTPRRGPKLLLADEPTGALDRTSAERLIELLVELNRAQHVTLLMVTHAPDLARRMSRMLELREGKLEPR